MDSLDRPRDLCRCWFPRGPLRIGGLAAGFSGARVFRVDAADAGGACVLKSFAAAASLEHAAWVHSFAGGLRRQGIDAVPAVMKPEAVVPGVGRPIGPTLVADRDGVLWEMVEFKPGAPVPVPRPAEAAAAAALLARVHLAAGSPAERSRGPSPGIARRIAAARDLRADPWAERLERRLATRPVAGPLAAAVTARLGVAAEAFAAAGLAEPVNIVAALEPRAVALQPVLRDVWCDHVLFAGVADGASPPPPVVSGLIDLHAAGIDTPATDLARLFGSWDPGPARRGGRLTDRWPEAFAAYERVRPLAAEERRLVGLLHAAGVIAGLDRWFRWTLDEGRTFPDDSRAVARIDRLLAELPCAAAELRGVEPRPFDPSFPARS